MEIAGPCLGALEYGVLLEDALRYSFGEQQAATAEECESMFQTTHVGQRETEPQ